MRHRKVRGKLHRPSGHRRALLQNLAAALIRHGRIRTTDAKAKVLRSFADRLVTLGKCGTLHARRRAFAKIRDREAVQKLFAEIAPRFGDRRGGYTRVVKLGWRSGDSAPLSLVEWTFETGGAEKARRRTTSGQKSPA
jgi:large subunit ribosomal protein L17